MKVTHCLAGLSLSVLLSACAVIRGEDDVDQGRQALVAGNYQTALGYFQEAEQADPNYIYGAELREGVLSYLGKAQYLTGNYAQARQTLERNLSQHRTDNFARLYLGLTLYRLGDQKAALANIQRGMNGIYNWLNYLDENFRFEFGQFWDEGGTIRAGIKTDLAMISSGNVDWAKLIADGERLGIAVEQEKQNFQVQSVGILHPSMMATGLMRCGLIELSCAPR
ncbi:MAG: tetratricopeptide repeat protein [Nitrospiraceae bacterium]